MESEVVAAGLAAASDDRGGVAQLFEPRRKETMPKKPAINITQVAGSGTGATPPTNPVLAKGPFDPLQAAGALAVPQMPI